MWFLHICINNLNSTWLLQNTTWKEYARFEQKAIFSKYLFRKSSRVVWGIREFYVGLKKRNVAQLTWSENVTFKRKGTRGCVIFGELKSRNLFDDLKSFESQNQKRLANWKNYSLNNMIVRFKRDYVQKLYKILNEEYLDSFLDGPGSKTASSGCLDPGFYMLKVGSKHPGLAVLDSGSANKETR